jgi:uncharacterized protein (DUF433 family)
MAQVFTYYRPDGRSEVRTQPEGPLPGSGEVWVRGRYAPPDSPSPLDVRVGKSGINVWMVIQWLKLSDDDRGLLLRRYGNVLTEEDVQSAVWFYDRYRAPIDQRIDEEMQPA